MYVLGREPRMCGQRCRRRKSGGRKESRQEDRGGEWEGKDTFCVGSSESCVGQKYARFWRFLSKISGVSVGVWALVADE